MRQAICGALASSPALTSLLSAGEAIFHRRAPADVREPFIVFDKQAGFDDPMFQGGRITRERWLVKAVDRNPSASRAEDIATQISIALAGVTLTLSTGEQAAVIRDEHVDYGEPRGDEIYQHCGFIFRVIDP